MIVVRRDDLELAEEWHEGDDQERWRGALPFEPADGGFIGEVTEHLAVVYYELEEGWAVGEHTHTAEEIVYVAQGEVAATVGNQTTRLGAGDLVVIPADAPHSLRNSGSGIAQGLGVFPTNDVSHYFMKAVMPYGIKAFEPATSEESA